MGRFATVLMTAILASATLTACGASSYCAAIEQNKKTLNNFGEDRTNKSYEKYADVLKEIAADAPKAVRADWKKLAEVTEGVLKANKSVGLKLEEVSDAKKLSELKPDQLTTLNEAYKAFNDTAKARAAVVKNAKQECKIILK